MRTWLTPYRGQQLKIQVGDAILYRNEFRWNEPATWLSTIIRFITQCPVNHTAVVSADPDGVLMLNEALGRGVVSRPLAKHLDRTFSTIVIRRDKRAIDTLEFITRANSVIGRPYDVNSLVWHALIYQLTRACGWKPLWNGKTGEKAEGKIHCAEYYAWLKQYPEWWTATTRTVFDHPDLETVFFELKTHK